MEEEIEAMGALPFLEEGGMAKDVTGGFAEERCRVDRWFYKKVEEQRH